jgi:hypothetical protein
VTEKNDPFAAWRQMLSAWETNVSDLANRPKASEEFSEALNKAAGATHGAREAFETGMRSYLAAMNLPTRQEIEAIGERLGAIETQLHRLMRLVEGVASKTKASKNETSSPKPRRARPPETDKGSQ